VDSANPRAGLIQARLRLRTVQHIALLEKVVQKLPAASNSNSHGRFLINTVLDDAAPIMLLQNWKPPAGIPTESDLHPVSQDPR
jgi:hypothetical protein